MGWGRGCAPTQTGRPIPTMGLGAEQKWDSADSPFRPHGNPEVSLAENACHVEDGTKSCSQAWSGPESGRAVSEASSPPPSPLPTGPTQMRHIRRTVAVETTESSQPHSSGGLA